ncbi:MULTISPECIES: hypothetical protein [Streptomyces]|uniref:hypothetical protein n=1 Tax=Streptomyces TaxID=1883 RepID=UPI000A637429|nr:hypothetical protein [Streptomyces sp. SID7805]MYU50522.1 hypothetical protein [Streptomyces sp. SID7805]
MGTDRAAPPASSDALIASMPLALKEALPLVPWRIDELWRLDLLLRRVPVQDLVWLLDPPLWRLSGERFRVVPREVRDGPEVHPDHPAVSWRRPHSETTA